MILKTWTELLHTIGELQGFAAVLDMTEEVDLKKLKGGINEIAGKLKTIAEEEGTKLEDVKRPEPKQPVKKPVKKKEITP